MRVPAQLVPFLVCSITAGPLAAFASPPERSPIPACPRPDGAPCGAPDRPPEPLGHKHLVPEQRLLPRSDLGGAAGVPRPPTHLMSTGMTPIVTRDVLGYLPYWSYSANDPYVPLRWDLLTILAWFSVNMDGSGTITDRNGWGGATTAAIVQEAHAHGVRVIVTVTNFNGAEISSIVNDASNRQRAIESCLELMDAHGADGINIDFEFVPKAARDGFVTFMTELTDAVRAAAPNGGPGHVSLAGPAIDWSGAYDYDVLLENTDGIMVMAYGYHWTQSTTPGPTSPLFSGDVWSSRSVSWTIDDYLTYGGSENRGHVIIGLPWYGRSWKVANTDIPGVALSDGATRTFKAAEPEALALGKGWEEVSQSTYYHKSSGGELSQIWYDDGRSFEAKIAYVDEMDLGGIGIWALGYEGAYPDLWDAIDHVLAEVAPQPEVVETAPEPSPEVVEPQPEAVEPTPEPSPEPGPEPTPEPAADVVPDADPGIPDIERPGSPYATPLDPQRSLKARSFDEGGGCRGGEAASPLWLAGLVLALGALRRAQRGLGRMTGTGSGGGVATHD
jgi:spore germination protein YaaH